MISAVMLGSADATTTVGKGERDGIVAFTRAATDAARTGHAGICGCHRRLVYYLPYHEQAGCSPTTPRAFEAAGVTYMVADWTNYPRFQASTA